MFQTRNPRKTAACCFAMHNVIMTPHVATNSTRALAQMSLGAATGVYEVLSGKTVTWPIV
jgi:phosphoglycerate dehydrogenase-like enzyme